MFIFYKLQEIPFSLGRLICIKPNLKGLSFNHALSEVSISNVIQPGIHSSRKRSILSNSPVSIIEKKKPLNSTRVNLPVEFEQCNEFVFDLRVYVISNFGKD